MIKSWWVRVLWIAVGVLSLAGCSVFGPVKNPPVATYTLTVKNNQAPTVNSQRPSLLVAAPVASPGYEESDMVYVTKPYQLSHYANSRWIAAPADMLAPLIMQNLRASGCLRAVVVPPFAGNTDLTLNTQVLALQQEFLGYQNQERLSLAVTLVDSTSQRIIAQRRFECVVPAYPKNPYAGVVAANQATAEVLQQVTAFVCRYAHS